VHGRLGHGIGEHSRKRPHRRHAPDGHDAGAGVVRRGPGYEKPSELLAGTHHRQLVDSHDALELLVGDLEERRAGVDAGPVHEHVHTAVRSEHPADQVRKLVAAGGVARLEAAVAVEAGEGCAHRLALGLVAAHYDGPGAGPGERAGNAAPEHAGAADHHGDPAVETERGGVVTGPVHRMSVQTSPASVPELLVGVGGVEGKERRRAPYHATSGPQYRAGTLIATCRYVSGEWWCRSFATHATIAEATGCGGVSHIRAVWARARGSWVPEPVAHAPNPKVVSFWGLRPRSADIE
jgi:hypothetical protein